MTGTGIESDPYVIYTAQELAQLATWVNAGNTTYNAACYKLNNDIDLSDYGENFNGGKGWIPIGNMDNHFKGIFNGNEYKIINLFSKENCISGLFGRSTGAKILNLGIINVKLISQQITTGVPSGGIASVIFNTLISNCYITGDIDFLSGANPQVGSFVGLMVNNSKIINSFSNCILNGFTIAMAGGIVGVIDSIDSIVSNCYSLCSITSYNSGLGAIGGICGINRGSCINNTSLNNCITTPASTINRIVNNNTGIIEKNIAYDGMLLNGNTVSGTLADKNGEDWTKEMINADGTLGGRFLPQDGWTVENGKLPGLFGQPVEMPEYLKVNNNNNTNKMGKIIFSKGNFAGLEGLAKTAGQLIWTEDTHQHFLDVDSSTRVELTNLIIVANQAAANSLTTAEKANRIVYFQDVNAFFKHNGTEFMRITAMDAKYIAYSSDASDLTAGNVKDAIDELANMLDNIDVSTDIDEHDTDTNAHSYIRGLITTHTGNTSNPHATTYTQVGAAAAEHAHSIKDLKDVVDIERVVNVFYVDGEDAALITAGYVIGDLVFVLNDDSEVVVNLFQAAMFESITFDNEEKELVFILAGGEGEEIRISLGDLIPVYTGATNNQIQVSINSGSQIEATLLTGTLTAGVAKTHLTTGLQNEITGKVDIVQGSAEANKILVTNGSGNVVTSESLHANQISYKNGVSELEAEDVQGAIDELKDLIDNAEVSWNEF